MYHIFTVENIYRLVRLKMDKQSNDSHIPEKIAELLVQYRHLKEEKKAVDDKRKILFKRLDCDHKFEYFDEIESEISAIDESIEQNKLDIEREASSYSEELLRKIRKKDVVSLRSFLLGNKTTYCSANFDSEILISLLKSDIRRHYKQIPANRNNIVVQLKGILDNDMPKFVIRADVRSCFEHVSFVEVISKLEKEGYVSNITLWYLKQISQQTRQQGITGIPRGLSFSSDLVEIFFQGIDRDISFIPGIYFYKRYVDDIIIVLSAPKCISLSPDVRLEQYWQKLNSIFNKYNLMLHEAEGKKKLVYLDGNSNESFNYLGYKFCINGGKLNVGMSDNKIQRYEHAIEKIIEHFNLTAHDNESLSSPKDNRRRKREQPLRRLFGQLSALTGNGKLSGVKSNILTGIYYSNQHLTSASDLKYLDNFLKEKISTNLIFPDNLFKYNDDSDVENTVELIKQQLKHWSFEEGFARRRFCKNKRYCSRLKEIKNLCR